MRRIYLRFSMLLPVLLAAILFIPFVMNFLAHAWFGEKQFAPLVMTKLPVDSSAISLPDQVKQFESFTVGLQLDTEKLARRINNIVEKSPAGISLQGVSGRVFPEMQAELSGDTFDIHPPEPQAQLYSNHGDTSWSWAITPDTPGRHALSLKLHLQTADTSQEHPQIVELAEIQVFVEKNTAEWMKRYGIWYIAIALLVAGWVWKKWRARNQTA
ncbi:hypothetical protein [Nitrosomonas halophila]|uniref:Uncharacterized protein n=1 Tax=Nitrosomonas halophila TaxID=44576 RepID=A0A1H3PF16_9PROT|nr:hypothetical protein [Nitrosomonas halophila]SDY99744.1 hypothetical protein SAMN05421881_10975 [Nitrosomonas halophila]